jgi:YspA, cpYpsA-related SLOG family
MRILVCGGRGFKDCDLLNRTLDDAHTAGPISVLIHGLARGADSLAAEWAERNHVDVEGYRADWKKYGPGAGPIRNAEMLKKGHPKLVIAFKGGDGTRNMVKQARAAGVPVLEIK